MCELSVQSLIKYGFSFPWGRKNNAQCIVCRNVSQQIIKTGFTS